MNKRKNKGKQVATLVLTVFFVMSTFLISGCGRWAISEKSQSRILQEGEGSELWKPFALRPGDYFKYAMTDHVQGGKQGWITVQIKEKGEGDLEALWDGELDGEKFSIATAAPSNRLIELSRPNLITIPGTTPFLASVLASWWEMLGGFKWQVGAKGSVSLGEMVPAGFLMSVEDYCTIAGQKGFKSQMKWGDVIISESCISPQVPLPLWVLTNDVENKPRYEARLVEYRR